MYIPVLSYNSTVLYRQLMKFGIPEDLLINIVKYQISLYPVVVEWQVIDIRSKIF